ncbi:MAG TPA: histidine kinase [Noviherbaspirillum sp.]|uniref:sensor histidine kinase n=1 Tax=Noviherbaspirillum sp. TaxID=1926288 RepID=UPI002B49E22A|nr:histidine kinase [Noviherbaspirillum sp.]HJV85558.1 histidine kinase [Noviherbaspirillum sp.]
MPISIAPVKADRPTEILIPDCCNIGVVFRTLLAVNAVVLTAVLIQASDWKRGLLEFVEASMVVELSCLWSLFALCGLRRALPRAGAAEAVGRWAQRAACAAVPAAVTATVIYLLSTTDWLAGTFAHLTVPKGAVAAALLGAMMQHYFELRTRAHSPALVEARLQALQARIRPHFLFNSLNAVLALIRTEPRRAETTLEDLADLFRVLMSDPRNMTTLDNEIRLCQQYLSIEKIRLGERLQVAWETGGVSDDVLRKAQIPVLLLQPLLENAVHYGVEPAAQASPVKVQISRSIDRIEILVVNAYHGQAPVAAGNQMALNNIRERLALLYDVEAQLTTSIAQNCFEVRLRFPYVKGGA